MRKAGLAVTRSRDSTYDLPRRGPAPSRTVFHIDEANAFCYDRMLSGGSKDSPPDVRDFRVPRALSCREAFLGGGERYRIEVRAPCRSRGQIGLPGESSPMRPGRPSVEVWRFCRAEVWPCLNDLPGGSDIVYLESGGVSGRRKAARGPRACRGGKSLQHPQTREGCKMEPVAAGAGQPAY